MLELPPETLIHSLGGLFRAAHHGLNVDLKATVQKLVYFPVIIVIIPGEQEPTVLDRVLTGRKKACATKTKVRSRNETSQGLT